MSESERPTCGTCPYWKVDEHPAIDGELGWCQRHPPTLVAVMIHPMGDTEPPVCFEVRQEENWPKTVDDDWCGEHPGFPAYLEATITLPRTAAGTPPPPPGRP